ncbi:hypothetical protein OE88DRAFT_1667733 [Heliocybe sulcata]|uniref:Uncharacterized protein n=1 Tax=Heliocybe sulcata TaxID=5364 RepID=A0A5C3MLV2_9AGAM|nr:hypothetical protein OE88DRAFT_1667733 [Heliocybe sulcata]
MKVWESDGWHPSRPGPLCQHLMQCDGQPGTVKERARDEHEERNTKRCEARRLHKNGGQRPSGGTGARYAPHAPQNRGQQTHHDSLAGFHTSGGSTVTSAVPHLSPYMFSPIRASEAASVLPYVPEYGMAQYSGESWAYLGRTQYSGNYNEPIVDTGYAVMSQVAGQNREPPPPSNPGQHAEYGLATGSHMIQESIAVPTATCCGPQSLHAEHGSSEDLRFLRTVIPWRSRLEGSRSIPAVSSRTTTTWGTLLAVPTMPSIRLSPLLH